MLMQTRKKDAVLQQSKWKKRKDASHCRSTKSIITKLDIRIDWPALLSMVSQCLMLQKLSKGK